MCEIFLDSSRMVSVIDGREKVGLWYFRFINGLKNGRAIPNHFLRLIHITYVCTLIRIIVVNNIIITFRESFY